MHRRSVAGWMMGVLLAGLAGAQPVQWRVEDGGNGHWYQAFVRNPITWTQSRTAALAMGGDLVSLTTEAESDWVYSRIASNLSLWNWRQGPWIGLFQDRTAPDYSEPAGGWRWVDGAPLGYTRWLSGAPIVDSGPCILSDRANYLMWPSAPMNAWGSNADEWYPSCHVDANMSYIIEWSADCNNDGIVDKGQILSGELPDANNNGIPDGGPTITSQPIDQNVGVDVPVTFIVEVGADPACTTPVTFQWQRRNPLVADPAAANAWIDLADGNGFLNTRTPGLIIVRPTPGLATGYRCKMSGGCGGCEPGQGGFVYTNTVNFTIACPSDFNADGGVDFGDLELFFERWENGC